MSAPAVFWRRRRRRHGARCSKPLSKITGDVRGHDGIGGTANMRAVGHSKRQGAQQQWQQDGMPISAHVPVSRAGQAQRFT